MLMRAYALVVRKLDEIALAVQHPRSGRWPAVRAAHLREHPSCAACGSADHSTIQVHHCVPYHLDRTKELDLSNLLSLCEDGTSQDHFHVGHNGTSWRDFNPHVRADAARMLAEKHAQRQYALATGGAPVDTSFAEPISDWSLAACGIFVLLCAVAVAKLLAWALYPID